MTAPVSSPTIALRCRKANGARNDWTEDFKDLRGLLRARLHAIAPAVLPDAPVPLPERKRMAIAKEFVATHPELNPDTARSIVMSCLDYACDYTPDGDPFRWSPVAIEVFLLGWLPRKVMPDAGAIGAIREVMKAWVNIQKLVEMGVLAERPRSMRPRIFVAPEISRLLQAG
ncbi:MAG: hypothetical protein ACRDJM_03075 [Actinomycetota bacterium]